MSVVSVHLNFPFADLSPNARLNWHAKAAVVAEYKHECKIKGLNARRAAEAQGQTFPLRPPLACSVTFVVKNNRRRDYDNLIASLKSGMDGLVAAGLIEDDSTKVFQHISYGWQLGVPAVIVKFEEVQQEMFPANVTNGAVA